MERIRSWVARALGGAARVRGGGLLAAACSAALLAGVGCTGSRALRMSDVLPEGWVPCKPASQITPAFNPQVQYLPDPTKEGTMRPGIVGQMFVLAADGSFTDARGDVFVMAEDITPRPPGQPPAITEVWHFDPATLKKMRTADERFGECYALFLPYPSNWKDVAQVRVSTQFKPKGDPTKEPTLPGPPQVLTLDFTPPGQQASVWLDKGTRVTSPVEMKAMPNVARDLAKGGLTAPHTGTPLGVPPNGYNTGTVVTGGMMPPNPPPAVTPGGPIPPAAGPIAPNMGQPFTPPAAGAVAPPPQQNTPQLPPPMQFTPDRPQATIAGPNGEPLKVTAMALPPGQSVPDGWRQQRDGSIQQDPARPGVVQTGGTQQQQYQPTQGWTPPGQQGWIPPAQTQPGPQQWGQTQQPANYQPASAGYVPASQRPQPRIQHGAIGATPPQGQVPQGPLPQLPASVLPQNRNPPPVTSVPVGNVPPMPTGPSGVGGPYTPPLPTSNPPAGPVPPAFNPASPVGPWANQPTNPIQPPPPPGGGGVPTLQPPLADAPLVPAVIPGGIAR